MIFYMRLGIHKIIYLIHSIHIGVVNLTSACKEWFSILNLEYVKTELSYDTDFLYMGCIWKQQIDSVISSSLTVWFLWFLANQIAWFCNIKCSQNGLVFWLCSLYDSSASWLEATEMFCSWIGVGILCRYPFKSRLLGSREDCLELRRKSVLCQGIDFEQLLKLININLDIQFNYMQYNQELKHGK